MCIRDRIRNALSELDGQRAMQELKEQGALHFDFDGTAVELTEADLLIDSGKSERYVTEADNTVTVVLDTQLSEALIEEGYVRELISKVQTMRKEAGFEVTDHITLYENGNETVSYTHLTTSTRFVGRLHNQHRKCCR